jgi:hypothetical protein
MPKQATAAISQALTRPRHRTPISKPTRVIATGTDIPGSRIWLIELSVMSKARKAKSIPPDRNAERQKLLEFHRAADW